MKLKEMKKLAKNVNKAVSYAEEIKTKVHGDLEDLATLDQAISENLSMLNEMNSRVADATKTLEGLMRLLE